MALNLTGVFSDIGNLASSVSGQDVLQNLAAGAIGTVVLSGLGTAQGQNAIDPLHIFIHPQSGTSGVVSGSVMPMSKFLALSPDQQKMIQALNYTIVPG